MWQLRAAFARGKVVGEGGGMAAAASAPVEMTGFFGGFAHSRAFLSL